MHPYRSLPHAGLALIISLSSINCSKDNGKDNSDEYYVKYEVSSTTIYFGGKLDFTITTEDNNELTLIINQNILHETIIGPVTYDFDATMEVSAQGDTRDRLALYTNIFVSKNGSPFALKATDGTDVPRDFVELKYTIDY